MSYVYLCPSPLHDAHEEVPQPRCIAPLSKLRHITDLGECRRQRPRAVERINVGVDDGDRDEALSAHHHVLPLQPRQAPDKRVNVILLPLGHDDAWCVSFPPPPKTKLCSPIDDLFLLCRRVNVVKPYKDLL